MRGSVLLIMITILMTIARSTAFANGPPPALQYQEQIDRQIDLSPIIRNASTRVTHDRPAKLLPARQTLFSGP